MGEPRLLILETSGRSGQVAVALGDQLLQLRRLDEARRNARDLAPTVDGLLRAQGWQARQLDAVIVSRGPGSYTGLRVGLISAKVLAYATGCPLLAVETFAAVAQAQPADGPRLEVIADAQQSKVYAQTFERGAPSGWRAASALAIRPLAEWLADLPRPVRVAGPGLDTYADRLPADLDLADESARHPQAEALLQLGLARFRAGERDDVWSLDPLYLRPSSAEEKWQRR